MHGTLGKPCAAQQSKQRLANLMEQTRQRLLVQHKPSSDQVQAGSTNGSADASSHDKSKPGAAVPHYMKGKDTCIQFSAHNYGRNVALLAAAEQAALM
jgi:hypothetical protein